MPELTHDCQFSGGNTTTSYGSVSSTGFWSKRRDDVSYNQLQKFWSELSLQARQELLRIDKQNLFEQARKNMYCSRCNGLLLEGFMQIIMYGKSLQNEGTITQGSGNNLRTSKSQTAENKNTCLTIDCNDDDIQDPSVHPWGGLTTTKDGTLTLLDCYIYSKYLNGLQNVFDSARSRERERELLYPDACGRGSRGWINQGMVGYGRGHGTRETCALHTARLSVDTLVDFWSALGEETRYSLLRMKEEDFMERLMYRFDNKRFCRDCRKNVVREFKELKELKRMRREARCTSWFCVADTSFQYEVTRDTVQADWHQTYADSTGLYKHYEWAVGTGEGKSDILEFENVGSNTRVQMNGLDLAGLNSCYITLRARRTDGRCNEVSVKAHALKGQNCVHGRLVVGDGFVTITRGKSIRRFFEHAEEAEEEEDDDSMDKDENELDGECSRPQKHANSPELAREFLLDAATVIFKEQVEKAFREGTARQNAHSMFVSLALKLLEERVMVACKDIITLEKQFKLLEEEEKEKRDEEERKERRRAKEKEKKLRRKERLRSKELEKEKKCGQQSQTPIVPDSNKEELTSVKNEPNVNENTYCEEESTLSFIPASGDYTQEEEIVDYEENSNTEFSYKQESKHPQRRLKSWNNCQHDQQPSKWADRPRFETSSRNGHFNGVNNKPVRKSNRSRYNERLNCYLQNDYRPKVSKPEPDISISKPYFRGNKYTNQTEYVREKPKSNNSSYIKKVWEPRTNHDSDDVIDRSADVIKPNAVPTNQEDNDLKESKSSAQLEADTTSSVSGTTDLSSCSSCVSEGDGNTSFSSGPQNAESSPTSDSEYTSHHSELIKEDFPEVKNTKDNEVIKKENSGELSSKTIERNDVIIQPMLQAHSLQFPVFQAPSMGYYHQGSVPWAPLPHPGYLYATPFGYGYYHQGVAPPLINHSQPPIYQPVFKDHTKVVPIKSEVQKTGDVGQNGNSDKTLKSNNNDNDTGFSLFHFGGPVDVSNGFKPDEVKACSITSGDSCATNAMEEYNLFAASNGIKFSFF